MSEESQKPSRRNFLRPVAAGAAAAAFLPQAKLMAAPPIPSITIPKDLPTSLGENPKVGSFEGRGMTGAEVFAKLCKDEDLAALFCCPGNYTVINAIAAAGVPPMEAARKAPCAPWPTDSRASPVKYPPAPVPKAPASPT